MKQSRSLTLDAAMKAVDEVLKSDWVIQDENYRPVVRDMFHVEMLKRAKLDSRVDL